MKKNVKDHKGNEFRSYSAMAKAYGISISVFFARLNMGWSIEKILTAPKDSRHPTWKKKCTDPFGNEFESIAALCKFHNLSYHKYIYALKHGTVAKLIHSGQNNNGKFCTDHKGAHYESMSEMARGWKIKERVLISRLNAGWSVERALTTPEQVHAKECTDHLGQRFKNRDEMCKFYNVKRCTFNNRINRYGWTVEQALTTPNLNRVVVSGLNGEHYHSIKEMASAYKRQPQAISRALSICGDATNVLLPKEQRVHIYDHNGQGFPNTQAMCEFHGVKYTTYNTRLSRGMSKKDALNPELKTTRSVVIKGVYYASFREWARQNDMPFRWAQIMKFKLMNEQNKSLTEACRLILLARDRRKLGTGRESVIHIYQYKSKKYVSLTDMCRSLGIGRAALLKRMKKGQDMTVAIEEMLNKKKK